MGAAGAGRRAPRPAAEVLKPRQTRGDARKMARLGCKSARQSSDSRQEYYRPSVPNGFQNSRAGEPHRNRTKAILAAHPEVRGLIGRNPFSALAIVGVVSLQLGLAFVLREQPWWLILLVAYAVGAFANHSMYVMIHECAHNLLHRRPALNKLASIVADIPNVLPAAISFRTYHLKHHAFQGVHELDADLPHHWEAKLIGNHTVRKALWLLAFPVFQALRPLRIREISFLNGWTVLNWALAVTVDVAIVVFWGWPALLYLVASFFFSIGLHPLGARWIQEHYTVAPPQETYSYYGPANTVAFNVGFHNEHHDFPSIAWNRLPELRAMAPEFYDGLVAHRSWTKLLLQFLFRSDMGLHSRVLRDERQGIDTQTDANQVLSEQQGVS